MGLTRRYCDSRLIANEIKRESRHEIIKDHAQAPAPVLAVAE